MRRLWLILVLAVFGAVPFHAMQPAAAATVTITSGKPASPVTAYVAYPMHTFTASGGAAPYTVALRAGSLPVGLALASVSRTLSGTPTTPGSYSFTVRVLDANGLFADQDVTVVVKAPPVTITSGKPASPVTAYLPYPPHTFTASGGAAPYTLALRAGALPPGMALASVSRTLSGTPTTPGTYTFVVRLTDAHGFYAEQSVTVVVQAPAITITSGAPPTPWYTAQSYPTHTFAASGGTGPYTVALRAGALPPGMALASVSRTLSGTPTTLGSYSFVVRVVDAHGFYADQDVTVEVMDPAAAFTSGPPPAGQVGLPYTFRFTAAGDSAIRFAVTDGALPDGLTLASDGELSGTPEHVGSFAFTVTAKGTETAATLDVTLVVAEAPVSSPPASSPAVSSPPDPSPPVSSPPVSPAPTVTPSVAPASGSGPGAGLPDTGADVTALGIVGAAALFAGALMAWVTRRGRARM